MSRVKHKLLYSRAYFMDGSQAGYIIDLVFDRRGTVVAIILAKILLPAIKVGLILQVIPYKLVKMFRGKYYVLAPKALLKLKRYLYTYLDPIIVDYTHGKRLHKIIGLVGLAFFAITLLISALIYRGIGIILYLIATSIIITLPFLLYLALRINIPGYLTVRSIVGSRVYDSHGYFIGIVSDIVMDTTRGIISSFIVTRPVFAKSKAVEEIYSKTNKLIIDLQYVSHISNGVVHLNIPYTKIH